MLINLRNALMAGNRLPYDAEVEYLEATGTQFVNADIGMGDGHVLRTEVGVSFANTSTRQLNGSNGYYFWGVKSGKFECPSTIPAGSTGGTATANTWYSIDITFDTINKTASLSVDGGRILNTAIDRTNYIYTTLLFALGSRVGIVDGFYNLAKVRYAKYYFDGVLVRDFIPVRKGQVGYLYDRVTGKLFGNAGTGAFPYGNDLKYPIPA